MKIAAVQMVSTPDLERNLDAAAALVAQAAAAGAQIVCLPEYFCLLGRRDTDKLALAEDGGQDGALGGDRGGGPIQRFLAQAALRHGVWLVGGTLPVRADAAAPAAAVDPAARPDPAATHAAGPGPATAAGARVLNRCCVFAPDGSQAGHYDKLHLFAFDNGRESYDEGRTLQAGSAPVALDIAAWPGGARLRLGLSICYDLRFPELYRALMAPPCDLLCVPSAFTYTTGRAHWELLLRARAVENQCYVLAAAQGGTHENGRRTWGHSMVVDPWGEVLAVCEEGEGVAVAEIDPARIAQVRRQLPALAHRRL
jgi:nitrilase